MQAAAPLTLHPSLPHVVQQGKSSPLLTFTERMLTVGTGDWLLAAFTRKIPVSTPRNSSSRLQPASACVIVHVSTANR